MGKWGRSRRSPCHMAWRSGTARPQMCCRVRQWGQGAAARVRSRGEEWTRGASRRRRQWGARVWTRTGCGFWGVGEAVLAGWGQGCRSPRGLGGLKELLSARSPESKSVLPAFGGSRVVPGCPRLRHQSASSSWASSLRLSSEDTRHADRGPAPGDLILITSAKALLPNRWKGLRVFFGRTQCRRDRRGRGAKHLSLPLREPGMLVSAGRGQPWGAGL